MTTSVDRTDISSYNLNKHLNYNHKFNLINTDAIKLINNIAKSLKYIEKRLVIHSFSRLEV